MFSLRPSELLPLTTEMTFHHFLTSISWFNGAVSNQPGILPDIPLLPDDKPRRTWLFFCAESLLKSGGWGLSVSGYRARLRLRLHREFDVSVPVKTLPVPVTWHSCCSLQLKIKNSLHLFWSFGVYNCKTHGRWNQNQSAFKNMKLRISHWENKKRLRLQP